MNPLLTKSDFKLASTCPTKLFYKKNGYPSANEEDDYMELLAEGGYMVGRLAEHLYPGGKKVTTLKTEDAVAETNKLIEAGTPTILEAAFVWNGCLVRVDILNRTKSGFDLIEVKSKGYDPDKGFRGARGGWVGSWKEYVEDVTFQRWVARGAMPNVAISAYLLVPDKTIVGEVEGLPARFTLTRKDREILVSGDIPSDEVTAAVRLLKLCPVDDLANELEPEVVKTAKVLLSSLEGGAAKKIPGVPRYLCADCEYRMPHHDKNGFAECWGALANVTPSLFDLNRLGYVKEDKLLVAERLIREGKVSLFDIPAGLLTTSYGPRQKIQIEHTKANTEWRDTSLKPALQACKYPLHFIDFETSRLALPYHRKMTPWEQVAFQWSCHTIRKPGAKIEHKDWINLDPAFPSFGFAEELRAWIGDAGTVFTWSHHEASTLKDIARQIDDYCPDKADLKNWLLLTPGRIFDLCAHAEKAYFHPLMAGKTSIKAVLPAIWRNNPKLRAHALFSRYVKEDKNGLMSPYASLPSIEIFARSETIEEGTGAMRAYQEMLYGGGRQDSAIKDSWKKLLLHYCELDTAAMVMIWMHWMDEYPGEK